MSARAPRAQLQNAQNFRASRAFVKNRARARAKARNHILRYFCYTDWTYLMLLLSFDPKVGTFDYAITNK